MLLDDSSFAVQLLRDSLTDHHPRWIAALSTEQGSRTPRSGEPLILADGRRFVFATVESDVRGWWFSAFAQDGRTSLQGNTRLAWDSQSRAWRPDDVRRIPDRRRVVRSTFQPRRRQPD